MNGNEIKDTDKRFEEMSFDEKLAASIESEDTEDWLDVQVTRRAGLALALGGIKAGLHPNVVSLMSVIVGIAAAVMFSSSALLHNVIGVVLMMVFAILASADGQMARLTGKKTSAGRLLDRLSGLLCFTFIYIAISLRLYSVTMPGTDRPWGLGIWVLCLVAGLFCLLPQTSLAEYYKEIHLWMQKDKPLGKTGRYHHVLVGHTPWFQQLQSLVESRFGVPSAMPSDIRLQFVNGSRPLMKTARLLALSTRVICLCVACLMDEPWILPVFEIVVLTFYHIFMLKSHESLSRKTYDSLVACVTEIPESKEDKNPEI